jgi:signal transduction histidine kinase
VPLPKHFQTSTFRFALVNLAVFVASMIIPFAFIYSSTVGSIDAETNAAIIAEIKGLADEYERLGHDGLVDVIADRSSDPGDKDAIYLLADSDLRPLAGNLSVWPADTAVDGQWIQFTIDQVDNGDGKNDSRPHRVRAQAFRLPGNELLLIGRDIHERAAFQRRITVALGWALAITLGLGVTGGTLMSRYMLRRVDAITQTSRAIVDGTLSRRMPVRGIGDEFDRLSENLNQMLDQIEQLMTSMRTVTDSVAHDLRGPLTHLKGRIELALRGAPDPKAYRSALEAAVTDTDRILTVFNALIEMAKAESGVGRTEMAALDLGLVAADVADLYEPVAEERGLAMTAEIADGAMLLGNRQLLAQALANLIDNAIKYTPPGGAVALSIASDSRFVRMTVADTGPGIPASERNRVLERFVRIRPDPSIPGSGLGLSLVAAVARLHRASLELADNEPGLKVTLVFPKVQAAAKTVEPQQKPEGAAATPAPVKP